MFSRPLRLFAILLLTLGSGVARAQQTPNANEPVPENVGLAELQQKAVSLDQKPVRIKFHYRGNIVQLDASRYYVRLYDKDYYSVWAEFAAEGLAAVKKFPTSEKYSATRGLYVFAKVRTPDPQKQPSYYYSGGKIAPVILDAFGTNLSKNISGEVKYVW